MRSRVVYTRVNENVLKELKREGISPAEVSRRAIEAEAARIRAKRALGVLEKKAAPRRREQGPRHTRGVHADAERVIAKAAQDRLR